MKYHRRDFLRLACVTLAAGATPSILRSLSFDRSVSGQLEKALLQWTSNEIVPPEDYILHCHAQFKDLNSLLKSEFSGGKLMTVDGFVITKFEGALLASIAQGILQIEA